MIYFEDLHKLSNRISDNKLIAKKTKLLYEIGLSRIEVLMFLGSTVNQKGITNKLKCKN